MLNALLLSLVVAMPQQDTTKTRISSDTTRMPPDTTQMIDTTGWLMTDSLALTDTTVTIQPGNSFVSEIWDYLITGLGLGPTPPDTSPPIILPPDTTPPNLNTPPAQPMVVQGPGCTDMADSVSYLCTVQFQPDVMVDSTYWRRGDGSGSTWFRGDSLQWAYVSFPCTVTSSDMDSRSYRNNLRSDPMVKVPVVHNCDSNPPVQPPDTTPPPGGWDVVWDFDDGSGVTCYGSNSIPCDWGAIRECAFPMSAFPAGAQGCYRKHSFLPTGGTNGSGAIVSHWETGMSLGFSPVWLTPVPISKHFMVNYDVRQSAVMRVGLNGFPQGSNRKLNRMYFFPSGGKIGTLLSATANGNAQWYWETWTSNDPVSSQSLGFAWPGDDQWHNYQMELNFLDLADMTMTFWLDGVFIKTVSMGSRVGDRFSGQTQMYFSAFLEMYSCGSVDNACSPGINTGDYRVDNMKYKDMTTP